jgi:hypothetical protein
MHENNEDCKERLPLAEYAWFDYWSGLEDLCERKALPVQGSKS